MSDDARKYLLRGLEETAVVSGVRARAVVPKEPPLVVEETHAEKPVPLPETERPTGKLQAVTEQSAAEKPDEGEVFFVEDGEPAETASLDPGSPTLLPALRAALQKISEHPPLAGRWRAPKAPPVPVEARADSEIPVWNDDEDEKTIVDHNRRNTLIPSIRAIATKLSSIPAAMAQVVRDSFIPALTELGLYDPTQERLPLQRNVDYMEQTARKKLISLYAQAPKKDEERYWWRLLLHKWDILEMRVAQRLHIDPQILHLGIVSFVLAFSIMFAAFRIMVRHDDMQAVDPKFLSGVSSQLVSGVISEKTPRVFFGQVSPDWHKLSYAEQSAEVTRIRKWVIVNDVQMAFLIANNATVAQVAKDKVIMFSDETPVDVQVEAREDQRGDTKEEKELTPEEYAEQEAADAHAQEIADQVEQKNEENR